MAQIKQDAVLEAIRGSNGIVSRVAERLGRDWNTARKYIDRWEATKALFEAEAQRVTDVAESRLIKAIDDGEQWAVKFWLTTKGKGRGFTERTEITGAGGGPAEIRVKVVDPE